MQVKEVNKDYSDSDFTIKSNTDTDDDDDNITMTKKGKVCDEHRKFKKGFCKFCLVCRYCIPLESCAKKCNHIGSTKD